MIRNLLTLFLFLGCAVDPKDDYDYILKYENDEVTCYRIRGYDGISCFQKDLK